MTECRCRETATHRSHVLRPGDNSVLPTPPALSLAPHLLGTTTVGEDR